jgi:peptidoglycan/LPS O-acetylase OafA/YrhL
VFDLVGRPLGQQPSLSGLRGVAIAAVLLYHAFGLRGGFLGVDVFFVLSGFLITTLLLEEHDMRGRISLGGFYRRRLRRLGPGFAAAMGLVVLELASVAVASTDAPSREIARSGLLSMLCVSNLMRTAGETVPSTVTALWSLAEEEQFYLLWPAILIVLLHRRVSPGRLCAGLVLAAVGVAAWRLALTAGGAPPGRIFFGPDTRSDGLLAGCALAAARRQWGFPQLRPAIAILPALLLSALLVEGSAVGYGYAASLTLTVVATSVVIVAALSPGPLQRSLSYPPIVWLGLISYGLYLWQGVVFSWAGRSLATIVLSVLLAAASYRFVETPLRRRSLASSVTAAAAA